MSQVCILTDSTAAFPTSSPFSGQELVHIIPFHIQIHEQIIADNREVIISQLPVSLNGGSRPRLIPPSPQDFMAMLTYLSRMYSEVVAIFISSQLSSAYENARQAVSSSPLPIHLHLIDSQTTSIGLGWIVQVAARAAAQGVQGSEIDHLIRSMISQVYTAFCTRNLTYLSQAGYLDPAQAVVGEMLDIIPFYILEDKRLTPIQKVRSPRHMVDLFLEFVSEFFNLQEIALVQGGLPFNQEVRSLKDRISTHFPDLTYSENILSPELGILFGPQSLAMITLDGGIS